MIRIWLDDGEPGIAENGTAYRWDAPRAAIVRAGTLAGDATGTGISFRRRHSTGFEIDRHWRAAKYNRPVLHPLQQETRVGGAPPDTLPPGGAAK